MVFIVTAMLYCLTSIGLWYMFYRLSANSRIKKQKNRGYKLILLLAELLIGLQELWDRQYSGLRYVCFRNGKALIKNAKFQFISDNFQLVNQI